MITIPSLQPLPFEVTYDRADLFVALKAYRGGGSTWVLESTIAMSPIAAGVPTYACEFTPSTALSYIVTMASYLDGTFAALDDRPMASESFKLDSTSGGGGSGGVTPTELIGAVDNSVIIGHVETQDV